MLILQDDDEDDNDEGANKFIFENCALNEAFQNVNDNPLVLQRGEANQRIARLPEISVEIWKEIKDYITNRTGELQDKGFEEITHGEAGGIKLMGNRVFLKICSQSTKTEAEFYEDYSHAAKVAGHDLKGLNAILSCFQAGGLHVPYTCIVDYKGYRTLVATAVPITEQTQINSKKYTGEHFDEFISRNTKKLEKAKKNLQAAKNEEDSKKYEKEIAALQEKIDKEPERRKQIKKDVEGTLSELAKKLNLRLHKFTDMGEQKETHFPFDFEIHEGFDGRIYGLDFARIMPPERPAPGKRGYLYRLMRMELVRKGVPLSPDAFLEGNDSSDKYEAEITTTELLQKGIIPEVAKDFLEEDERDATKLKDFMHKHGINLRYFGRFLYLLKQRGFVAKTLPAEMVARAYTHILNRFMRARMQDMIIKSNCANVLNNISNCREGEFPKELQEQLRRMYLPHLEGKEQQETASLFDDSTAAYWSAIVRANAIIIKSRIAEMTGIKLQRVEARDQITFNHVMKKIKFEPTPIFHLANGDYSSAKIYYKAELNLKRKILGPQHVRIAIALIYLAEVCAEQNTNRDNILAETYFNEAIEIYKTALAAGKDVGLDYAAALERKAKFLYRRKGLNDKDRIDKLLAEALQIKQKDGNQLEIARNLSFQAWVEYHAEQYATAIQKYNEGIQILRKSTCQLSVSSKKFNPNLRDFAMAHSNLALVVFKNGRPDKALPLCEKARRLLKKPYMNNLDKITAAAIEDTIGRIRDNQDANETGKAEPSAPVRGDATAPSTPSPVSEHRRKATKYFNRALNYRKDAFGEQHYLYAFSLDHVAQMLIKNGQFDDAFLHYYKALNILKQALGRSHSSVGILLHNIAVWFSLQGKVSRAIDAQRASLNALCNSLWDKHQLVKTASAALQRYSRSDIASESGTPSPLTHEGILAPDQPDPACFWGPYQSENHSTISDEQRKQFDNFVDLLTEVRAHEHDVNQDLINDMCTFCDAVIQPEIATYSSIKNDHKKLLFSRSIDLEEEKEKEKEDINPLNRRNTISSPGEEERIASGSVIFEFRDEDNNRLSFKPAKHVPGVGMGRDPGSVLALPRTLEPSISGGIGIGKGKDQYNVSTAAAQTTTTQVQAVTNQLESTHFSHLNTLVSISTASRTLDGKIHALSHSEKYALRQITRDLVYNNRLVKAATKLPFVDDIY